MNRQVLYILIIFLAVLTSCRERNPELFQDITGVYFNNRTGAMAVSDSIDITFVYEADDIIEAPVRVQLLGRTADRDRPLAITVDSENAEEGKDYLLPENAVLPAGASFTDYIVTLKRTEALKEVISIVAVLIIEIGRGCLHCCQVRNQRVSRTWRYERLRESRGIIEVSSICIDPVSSLEMVLGSELRRICKEI